MKRVLCIIIAAVLLCGCSAGAKAETEAVPSAPAAAPAVESAPAALSQQLPLFDFLGSDWTAWRDGYEGNPPVSLTVEASHCEYAEEPLVITDGGDIYAVFDALAQVTVGEQAALEESTDTTLIYTFEQANGTTRSLVFHQDCLKSDGGYYLISGTEAIEATGLWKQSDFGDQLTDVYAALHAEADAESEAQRQRTADIAAKLSDSSEFGPFRLLLTDSEAACQSAPDGGITCCFTELAGYDEPVTTSITLSSHDYNVLGVAVGDELTAARERFAEFEFVSVGDKFEFVREGVAIYCECEGGIISGITVTVS